MENYNETVHEKADEINKVPDDVILEIFAKLDFEDLCHCSQVCQRWYGLARSLHLKQIIIRRHLKNHQLCLLMDHHFHKRLETFEYLNNCDFTWNYVTKSTVSKLHRMCPQIKKLVLTRCSFASVTLHDMPPTLRHLSLWGSEIDPYEMFMKSEEEEHFSLTCLDLKGVTTSFTSENLHLLLRLKYLQYLYLEDCFRINNGGIECIIEMLPQLQVLDLEGTDISNEGVQIVIAHASRLKELYVGRTCIDDGALSNIPLDKTLFLTTLCVRNTRVSNTCIDQLYHFMKNLSCVLNGFDVNCAVTDFNCNHSLSHVCPG